MKRQTISKMATSTPAQKVIIIQNTHFDYVSRLTAHSIDSEIERMIGQGYFEEQLTDGPIVKYKNVKPLNIPGMRIEDQAYLIVVDGQDRIHFYLLAQ